MRASAPPLRAGVKARAGRAVKARVLSDGTKVTAPKFLRRAARKLKRLQQALSRKQKGSANRKKAVVKVARAHARVADTRRDWQHKLSTTIIRENQAVSVEDLCVAGLGRTRLAKSVHDAGWASFTAMLQYKAARHGRAFARVDRFFPSTRMCSACGCINAKMALNVRSWDCPCGQRTTGTSTPRSTCWPPDRRTTQTTVERTEDQHPCRQRAEKR